MLRLKEVKSSIPILDIPSSVDLLALFRARGPQLVVGRYSATDTTADIPLRLAHPCGKWYSRRQTIFRLQEDGSITVEPDPDCPIINYYNGAKLKGRQQLADGDQIHIGPPVFKREQVWTNPCLYVFHREGGGAAAHQGGPAPPAAAAAEEPPAARGASPAEDRAGPLQQEAPDLGPVRPPRAREAPLGPTGGGSSGRRDQQLSPEAARPASHTNAAAPGPGQGARSSGPSQAADPPQRRPAPPDEVPGGKAVGEQPAAPALPDIRSSAEPPPAVPAGPAAEPPLVVPSSRRDSEDGSGLHSATGTRSQDQARASVPRAMPRQAAVPIAISGGTAAAPLVGPPAPLKCAKCGCQPAAAAAASGQVRSVSALPPGWARSTPLGPVVCSRCQAAPPTAATGISGGAITSSGARKRPLDAGPAAAPAKKAGLGAGAAAAGRPTQWYGGGAGGQAMDDFRPIIGPAAVHKAPKEVSDSDDDESEEESPSQEGEGARKTQDRDAEMATERVAATFVAGPAGPAGPSAPTATAQPSDAPSQPQEAPQWVRSKTYPARPNLPSQGVQPPLPAQPGLPDVAARAAPPALESQARGQAQPQQPAAPSLAPSPQVQPSQAPPTASAPGMLTPFEMRSPTPLADPGRLGAQPTGALASAHAGAAPAAARVGPGPPAAAAAAAPLPADVRRARSLSDSERYIPFSKLRSSLICPVCLDLFRVPYRFACGHTVCGNCLVKCQENNTGNRDCVVCRETAEILPKPDPVVGGLVAAILPFLSEEEQQSHRQAELEWGTTGRESLRKAERLFSLRDRRGTGNAADNAALAAGVNHGGELHWPQAARGGGRGRGRGRGWGRGRGSRSQQGPQEAEPWPSNQPSDPEDEDYLPHVAPPRPNQQAPHYRNQNGQFSQRAQEAHPSPLGPHPQNPRGGPVYQGHLGGQHGPHAAAAAAAAAAAGSAPARPAAPLRQASPVDVRVEAASAASEIATAVRQDYQRLCLFIRDRRVEIMATQRQGVTAEQGRQAVAKVVEALQYITQHVKGLPRYAASRLRQALAARGYLLPEDAARTLETLRGRYIMGHQDFLRMAEAHRSIFAQHAHGLRLLAGEAYVTGVLDLFTRGLLIVEFEHRLASAWLAAVGMDPGASHDRIVAAVRQHPELALDLERMDQFQQAVAQQRQAQPNGQNSGRFPAVGPAIGLQLQLQARDQARA